ncbi:hypothetical protein CTZ28_08300 [Streptomyces shenzhenensis]|uniref:Uncharacterized protein n=1 Tax=Streptomyces shenzhenensis TaxID=943815 RepID=A0A3M0I9P3_9ACTN|nr:hypothetical protein CTZ28_08300 [Streptomyces shenzhenensis]
MQVDALAGAAGPGAQGVAADHQVVGVEVGAEGARGDLRGARDQAHRAARDQPAQPADADGLAAAEQRIGYAALVGEPPVSAVQLHETSHGGIGRAVLGDAGACVRGEVVECAPRGPCLSVPQGGRVIGGEEAGRLVQAGPLFPQGADPRDGGPGGVVVGVEFEMGLVGRDRLVGPAEPVQRAAEQQPGGPGPPPYRCRGLPDVQGELQRVGVAHLQGATADPQKGVEGVVLRRAVSRGEGADRRCEPRLPAA